ncbi:MAG: hypothetical protein KKD48_05265 [Nanoarchaeota archaeon]|nr:hypothetical protein [Nanoarchaeota archaeon]
MNIKSKIPKKIRVGGIDYTITLKNKFLDDDEHWGVCKNDLAEIVLITDNDGEKIAGCTLLSNLFYELCHAIDRVYCGQTMSEANIEKISTFWFQMLSDNYFFIENRTFPDKIRIIGMNYDVITNYKFDCVNSKPDIGIRIGTLEIRCSGDEDVNKEVLKRDLIMCITKQLVGNGLFSDEEKEEFRMESFCSGLYQVLKDTKLNNLIKEICE